MADDIMLAAETGRPTGSPASRRLRASGKVPAVIYGRGAEPAVISVDWRELRGALTTDKGLNALLTLKVGNKRTKAIVKELQRHPVRRDVLHVDFLAVDVDNLEIGQHITVGDVELPEGVTTEIDPEETIVTAKLTSLALAEEEEEEEAEEAEGEEAAEGEAAAGAEPGEAGSPQGGGEGGE